MRKKGKKLGFTLTELSIAIVFISILLLTIAVVTLNMIHSYHKGMAMKSINSTGLALIDEFTSAFADSPTLNVKSLCALFTDVNEKNNCKNDDAMAFVYQQFSENVKVTKGGGSGVDKDLPTAGVLCTGKYSYVWNTGYIISQYSNDHSMTSYFYSNPSPDPGNPDDPMATLDGGFRLRKYSDRTRDFCANNFVSGYTYTNKLNNTITATVGEGENEKPKYEIISDELIDTSDIALYSITINKPVRNAQSGRVLYSGSFVLGSITGDVDLNYDDSGKEGEYSSCNLEDTSTFDVEYCATNKFNFAIRAMGGNSGS